MLAFGDAVQKGGMSDLGVKWKQPAVAVVGTPDGRGYHVLSADGGVYSFGAAPFFGSLAGQRSRPPSPSRPPSSSRPSRYSCPSRYKWRRPSRSERSRALRFAAVDRRRFLTMLGVGGAAVGGGLAGSAIEVEGVGGVRRRRRRRTARTPPGPAACSACCGRPTPTSRVAAITFDDGPTPVFTPQALDVLAAARVPATFFMIGKLVADYSSIAKTGRRRRPRGRQPQLEPRQRAHGVRRSATSARSTAAPTSIKTVTGVTPAWYRPPRGMLVGRGGAAGPRAGPGRGHVVGDAGTGLDRRHRRRRRGQAT